jgi:hypothetical protein
LVFNGWIRGPENSPYKGGKFNLVDPSSEIVPIPASKSKIHYKNISSECIKKHWFGKVQDCLKLLVTNINFNQTSTITDQTASKA